MPRPRTSNSKTRRRAPTPNAADVRARVWRAHLDATAASSTAGRDELERLEGYGEPTFARWARNARREFFAPPNTAAPPGDTGRRDRELDVDLDVIGDANVFGDAGAAAPKTTRCKTCGPPARVLVFQRQTRSGDEGMTTFYVCARCQRQWRES